MASASSGSPALAPPAASATSTSSTDASPIRANANVAAEQSPNDSSKLKMFLGILRKFIGVSDIASVRFSLPAQLLEPTPNLEYWNYLDRPDTFVAIGDSDDELGRMLTVLRFWFTKDLKYVKGKPCKPYNSTLGEFFRCNWDVEDSLPRIQADGLKSSRAASIEGASPESNKHVRVSYLTEQTSHHPPVSAFYVDCPEKGITARGFDQISAKFTGTSVKVTPGEHNLGIFITLHKRDEETYQLTHPAAHLGGLIRGSLSVTVGDQCYVTCPKSKLKVILHYVEEGWLGKTQNKVEGVVFRYDPENDKCTRLRDVPEKDIVAKVFGNWKEKLYFSVGPSFSEQILLIDLTPLSIATKQLPPNSQQLPNESLRFWSEVTNAIKSRQYSQATNLKQAIEERQREKARQREAEGVEWKPRFFTEATTPVGRPDLTPDGREVLMGLQEERFELKESEVTAA